MSKILSFRLPLIAAVFVAVSNTALAADLDGATLFTERTCHTCHGKDASTPILPAYPSIGGHSKEYALQQMKDIKSGARSNSNSQAMKDIMHLVSAEEMEAIATYLATLDYKPGRAVSKVAAPAAAAPAANAATGEAADGSSERVWMTAGGERDLAMDLEPDRENGLEVYEVCAGCHLTEGWGKPDGTFPQLAGQHKEVLIKQLSDIRSKNRDNPTMYPFALPEAIGDTQALADVVDYIAKLPMNPDHGKGEWEEGTPEFDQGKQLYVDNCVKCHGETGEGKAEEFYPLIQGQHYNYMLRQFEWIRDGKRRNANPDMIEQINAFSDKDMQMVVNYVTRIPVPKEKQAPSKDWLNPDYD